MNTLLKLTTAILSVFLGIAFAYPLFYSDMIIPLNLPPKGPTANIEVNIVYASLTAMPVLPDTTLPKWIPKGENASSLTYDVVLNVTNDCDKAAAIHMLFFCAGKYADNTFWSTHFTTTYAGYAVLGAWVDGIWYNITIASDWTNSWPSLDNASNVVLPTANPSQSASSYPLLHQGVQIYEKYFQGEPVQTWMNMNGTWTDVTGRIIVSRPAQPTNMTTIMYPVVAETRMFASNADNSAGNNFDYSGEDYTFVGLLKFGNIWQPYESRLIELKGSRTIESSSIDTLANDLYVHLQASSTLVTDTFNGTRMDTSAMANSVQQISLQRTGNTYLYNNILGAGQTFQPDPWGVEVFIKNGS